MTCAEILEDARLAVKYDPVCLHQESGWRRYYNELHKAIRLSGGDLEICEALLRGEKVHPSRLDPEWVKAYGR